MSIGKLLIDDQPLQVLPSLAEAIGLNEALVLQQIHWLLLRSKNEFKGKSWVYNTYEEWQEKHFRFFSVSTIRRTIANLENLNLLISTTEFNQMKVDKTKWYSINYEALERLAITTAKNDSPSVQNEQSSCSNWADPSVQNEQTNNQENTQEIPTREIKKTTQKNSDDVALEACFEKFWVAGMRKVGKPQALKKFKSAYEAYNADYPLSLEDFTRMLVNDVAKRLRLKQFGFDNLHPATYLNNWRWLDDYPELPAGQNHTALSDNDFADDGRWAVGRKLNVDPDLIPEYLR